MNNQRKTKLMGKKYASVAQMVRDLSEDKGQGERTARKIEERNIVDFLMALRTSRKMSQADVAAKMQRTQSKLSKLEAGKDDDLRIGDFYAYADALGLEMIITLAHKNRTIVDQIKFHECSLKNLLTRLAKMSGDHDHSIADGSGKAICGVAVSILESLQKALTEVRNNLSHQKLPKDQRRIIQMQSIDDDNATGLSTERRNGLLAQC